MTKTLRMNGTTIIHLDSESGNETIYSLSYNDRKKVFDELWDIDTELEEGFFKKFYEACKDVGILSNNTLGALIREGVECMYDFKKELQDAGFYMCEKCDDWNENLCENCNKCEDGCCKCCFCEGCDGKIDGDKYDSDWERCFDCLENDTGFCQSCENRFWNSDLFYDDNNDCSYCENCGGGSEKRKLSSYHSCGEAREKDDKPFKFGVEVEKEDEGIENEYFEDLPYGWRCEKDGSLNSVSGFELVSPTFSSSKELEEVIEKHPSLPKLINGEYSSSCGGHIRISSSILSSTQIMDLGKTFIYFLYIFYEERKNSHFCEFRPVERFDLAERYQSLKFECGNRIEWRLFPAVENVECLIARIKMMEYFYISMIGNIPITIEWIEKSAEINKCADVEGKDIEEILARLKTFEEDRENLLNFLKK